MHLRIERVFHIKRLNYSNKREVSIRGIHYVHMLLKVKAIHVDAECGESFSDHTIRELVGKTSIEK